MSVLGPHVFDGVPLTRTAAAAAVPLRTAQRWLAAYEADGATGLARAPCAGWLRAHPGVKVVCRDRAGAYADGARDGAPDAVQVADRWHLWDNLCHHVGRLVAAHHGCLPEPVVPAPDNPDLFDPVDPVMPLWPDTVRIEHTGRRYDQIHELREHGLSMRAIARKLDLNFKTVRRYLRAGSVDILFAGGVRSSVLDSFKPYLHQRLVDGERNATVLHAEITERGYNGGYSTLSRYLQPLRPVDPTALAALSPLRGRPAVRQVAGWITGLPGHLDPADAERLHAIRGRCPELDAAVRHVAGFARMIKDLSGDRDTLAMWMGAVDADLPMLRSFTTGLRRDLDAVVAGLTLTYNSWSGGGHSQPHQTTQCGHVRTGETRSTAQADTPGLTTATYYQTTRWSCESLASSRSRSLRPQGTQPRARKLPRGQSRVAVE
jgi:hypothetical protein